MPEALEWKVERVPLDALEDTINALVQDGWTVFSVAGPDPGGGYPVIVNKPVKK